MKIGKLRHRITIEQVADSQDTDGSLIETCSSYVTAQGSIEPVSGREYFDAQVTQADVTHRIYLRYIAGVIPKMRVKYGARIFDILSVINTRERKVELQLMGRERID